MLFLVRVAQYFCVVLSLVSYQTLPIRPEHLNALPVRVAQYFCVVLFGPLLVFVFFYFGRCSVRPSIYGFLSLWNLQTFL